MSNEGKAADAVIRLLERRTSLARTRVRHSESINGLPPVELDFYLGEQHFALEHTRLQTFANYTRSAVQFRQLTLEIVDSLSKTLPKPGIYKLYFPTEALVSGGLPGIARAQAAICAWVHSAAAELHARYPARQPRDWAPRGHSDKISGTPRGLAFEVTLFRDVHWADHPKHDGVLKLGRVGPSNVDEQRAAQMTLALDKKCPKLQRFGQTGARTVLVLEDTDFSLSNYVLAGDAFEVACIGRTDLPDEVYLLDTTSETWAVRQIKDGNEIGLTEMYVEFDSSTLDDMTSGA